MGLFRFFSKFREAPRKWPLPDQPSSSTLDSNRSNSYAVSLGLHPSRAVFRQFLSKLIKEATGENAPSNLKDDLETIMKWLGVQSTDQIGYKQYDEFIYGMVGFVLKENTFATQIWCTIDPESRKAAEYRGRPLNEKITGVMNRLLESEMVKAHPFAEEIFQTERSVKNALSIDPSTIKWCPTCKYHRKSEEYEDVRNGLWRSKFIPPKDNLPCNIAFKTLSVWQVYFSLEQDSRTLFPKDCSYYDKIIFT